MLNLSGLTTFTGNRSRSGRLRHTRLEVLGAFNAASQMALLYPPGIDDLMRREVELARRDALHRHGDVR